MRANARGTALPVLEKIGAFLFLISMIAANSSAIAAAPIGSISVQVIVDGEDRSGGAFSVVILPADYPQPVVTEEVEQFAVRTERGSARVTRLEPGKYLVAIILPPRLMQETPPTSVEVLAPAWVQNSSGVTSGFWPAYEVEISEQRPNASVTFVRVGYGPPPYGVEIQPPSTGSAGLR